MQWLSKVMLRLLTGNILDRRNFVKTLKLREISELKTGPFGTQFSAKEYVSEGIPVINVKNIGYGNIISEGLDYVGNSTLERLSEHKLKTGDIVFGRKGSVDRHCLITKEQDGWMQGSDCIRVRLTDASVYSNFISYYLLTDAVKTKINNSAVGSTMASLNTDILGDVDINLPGYEEQYKIASVLSTIDQKIEKNKEINDYLEEMAKTIYDYWFVQFDFPDENGKPYKSSGGKMVWNDKLNLQIPNTWQSTELSSYGKIISGGTPSTENEDFYADDGIAWITPNDLSNNTSNMFISHGERDISLQGLNNSSANLIPSSSILLSTRAPIGYIAVSMNELTTNQGFKTLVPNDTDNTSFLYYLIKRNIPYLEQMGTGTTFKEVSKDSMEHLTVILPSDNILAHFFQKIKPYIMLRKSYEQETKKLISIRNWLLPIVMNGQATIED